ncbi:Uncharacterised protein [Serratia proteamaculans]|uniref:hypothetical protein n=1 Tax=Serratia TaxID=613 RepID=UPI00217711DB|nr:MULTISPECIES: hypothetical protein [Serratia]CAI1024125.1 Uncharacterised protein [Serratia entomophila]CAI1182137.1 Uncharacterised protein [Serratia quinivorans]CAI1719285.1 Uncharacterised protein [Serratia proteamaculans]CAI1731231.1 Uncharacterised protein [Serratia entomophila]
MSVESGSLALEIGRTILYVLMPFAGLFTLIMMAQTIEIIYYREHYKRTIINSIKKNTLKKEDLYIFLKKRDITYKPLDRILRQLFESSLKNEPTSVQTHQLRDLILWYEEQEGFTEIPRDVRENLEVIQKQSPEARYQVNRLATSLKDLYRTQAIRETRLRWFSYFSGTIGIIGVIYGVIQSWH